MAIKLEVIKQSDKEIQSIDITQLIGSIRWSGDIQEASRSLEFDMVVSPYDKNIPKVDVKCGDVVKFYENNKELFRGHVLNRKRSYNSTKMSFECLDRGFYLINNEGVYNFKNKSPEEVTKQICSNFGIPTGNIISTGYKFDKKFIGTNLDEIIMTFYTLASTKNNKKYMVLFKEDKLNVIEKGVKVLDVMFQNGYNIIDSQFSEDIKDIKTKVTVIDDDGKVVHTKVDDNLVKLYGSFQKVIKKEEGKDYKEQANQNIKDITQKAEIKGFGDTSCVTGYGVHVKDGYTGLTGLFYIDQDKHTWENGTYTIELTLNFKNIMNEVSAGQDEQAESSSSSSSGDSSNNSSSGNSSSSSSNSIGDKLVSLAKSKLGCKYVWGATGPNTFDCSGLTSWVHKQMGISIPRTSLAQSKSGKAVNKSDLQPGDLIFWKTTSAPVGHVGMYVGNGQFIHAPNKSKPVKYDSLDNSYYKSRYVCARRYY